MSCCSAAVNDVNGKRSTPNSCEDGDGEYRVDSRVLKTQVKVSKSMYIQDTGPQTIT